MYDFIDYGYSFTNPYLIGAVCLFLFGLNLLSNGLQKVAGDGLRRILAAMTSNPFKQILTGIGVTALIQSSTATTIMVVSFVNAGLLELGQAIGAYLAMKENLSFPYHQLKEINNAKNAETKINLFRDQLRDEHINNIESPSYNYQTGVYYMDIVAELERMGDFIINVSEAILEVES